MEVITGITGRVPQPIEEPIEDLKKRFKREYSNLSNDDISTVFALMCIQKPAPPSG